MKNDFKKKMNEIAAALGADPEDLLAVMAFESCGTLSPSIRNKVSGATGLIQFMEATAKRLGTSTAELAKMTAVDQLDYVLKYLLPFKGKLNSLEDVYMAVLYPAAVGKPSDYVLFSGKSLAYVWNRGLDVNKDGRITKKEATAQVRRFYEKVGKNL